MLLLKWATVVREQILDLYWPSVNILSSNLTATAPPKYANTYEINFMVVDTQTETVFNSYSTQLKGVGDSEEKGVHKWSENLKLNTQGLSIFKTI